MADYRVFIIVICWPVIGSDKETRDGPCSVCSYVMQQMPHPHSRGAMNNSDNHGTMASFINARGVQAWGGDEAVFLFSVTKICSCWGARQAE